MISAAKPKTLRSGLLTILIAVVIIGVLGALAIPNHVGGGPSKISGVSGMLRNVAVAKEEWATRHGFNNDTPQSYKVTLQEITQFYNFTRYGLVVDENGNLRNAQGVVFVINPLGVPPEARFTKAFNLSRDGGFFSPKIPKGTVMRFSTNTNSPEMVEYILPGQESKPYSYSSLCELLSK